jgi:predicted phosphatase
MIFIFDLDLTIWTTYDRHNNLIWAKQFTPPYLVNKNVITNDVGAKCVLKPGVKKYLKYLRDNNHELGFVSNGRCYGLPDEYQPSLCLLNLFDILKYFNGIKLLRYRDYDKNDAVKNIDNVIFYDDNIDVLNNLHKLDNVKPVDANLINDWSELIGKEYD